MPGPTKTQIEGDQIVAGSIADLEISATAAIQISKISINSSVLPSADNSYDLGSSSSNFRSLYLKFPLHLQQTGTGTHEITIEAPSAVTSSYALVLPAAQGASNTFLRNDGSGNLSWASGGSGANVALSNLSSVAINTALLPGVDDTIALGNSTHNFSSLFLKTSLIMQQTGLGTNAISIQPPSSMASSYSLVLPASQGGASTVLSNDGSGNLSWAAGGGVGYREDYIVGTALNNYTGSTTVFNLVNPYTVGGHTLIVTEDGDIQTLGASADYLETNSTTVTFNYALVVGQRVSFIFSQPATSPSGTVNSGTTGQIAYFAAGGTTLSGLSILPVASGGTGLATLTAHNVLLGEGTSSIGFAAPSTAGYVLTSNGPSADPTFQAGGTGTVNSGTATHLSYYATSTTAVSDANGQSISGAYTFTGGAGALTLSGSTIAMGANKITNLANGTVVTDAAAFGQVGVLQTVYATYATQTSTTSTSYVDTGIAITINPKLNTSNVIIDADIPVYLTGSSAGGAPTADFIITDSSNNTIQEYLAACGFNMGISQPDGNFTVRIRGFKATPSTGASNYKVRVRVNSNSGSGTNTVKTCHSGFGQSTAFITAQEIQ